MAKKTKKKKQPRVEVPVVVGTSKVRIRKPAKPRFLSVRKPKLVNQKKLPSTFSLLLDAKRHIWRNRKVFFGVVAVFLLLNLIFVKGFASTLDISNLKDQLLQTGSGASANVALVNALFGAGNSGSTEVSGLYQSLILIIVTLAFVWLYRHTSGPEKLKIKIRQPFYDGMSPLVPFLIVMCVIGLQLIPMLAGLGILGTVLSNNLAATGIEQTLWALLTLALTILTFYLISSSLFALVIVTLPGTGPRAALKDARQVVAGRRWIIMRKLLLMAIIVAVGFWLLIFLSIAVVPLLAEWIFFGLSAVLVPVVIGFIYKLYRAML